MKKLKIYCEDPNCMPTRAHPTDAGLDLRAVESYRLGNNEIQQVKTGIHVEICEGFVGLIFPRSSLGKHGVRLANTIGVIDSDYRGEIICLMQADDYWITKYDRIAQLVVVPIATPIVELVGNLDILSKTNRGHGGFGSTGKQ